MSKGGSLQQAAGLLLLVVAAVAAHSAPYPQRDPSLLQGAHRSHRSLLGATGPRQPRHRACGTAHDHPLHIQRVGQASGKVQAASSGNQERVQAASAFPSAGVTLPINFHVVHWQGYSSLTDVTTPPVSNEQIIAQVAVLNADYSGTGLRFAAPTIKFYENQAWTGGCWGMLGDILTAVNTQPEVAVNILVCDLAGSGGILGVMPDPPYGWNEADPSQVVAIDYRTMPGGPYDRFSSGRTLTHELGHYFGLLHTFGSCDGNGGYDGILDTPAQLEYSSGCPVGRDTCPDQPGQDAPNNFMDYSDDACMTTFTPGQAARMQAVVTEYRPALLAVAMRQQSSPPPPPQKVPGAAVPAAKHPQIAMLMVKANSSPPSPPPPSPSPRPPSPSPRPPPRSPAPPPPAPPPPKRPPPPRRSPPPPKPKRPLPPPARRPAPMPRPGGVILQKPGQQANSTSTLVTQG